MREWVYRMFVYLFVGVVTTFVLGVIVGRILVRILVVSDRRLI